MAGKKSENPPKGNRKIREHQDVLGGLYLRSVCIRMEEDGSVSEVPDETDVFVGLWEHGGTVDFGRF